MAISEGSVPQTSEGTTGTLQSKERIYGGALEDGHLEEQAWEREESGIASEEEKLLENKPASK